ncbi:MAG TPA: MBL fold metallo-hydrolase [Smithella sp.]|nr:MBL fold metallo-hydrolase [Smithella sp.]HNY51436.1 MBL fold metallo-hydrolase [Smithella sp.]HOG91497.1 MBL fold metallo-hydrolase [Smithella sp.]HOU51984.1 MBL fold metallo-hydrolase [Smithella sp.]HQG66078.1 MBL fold metallo-hydrolase [Smithella sp.]
MKFASIASGSNGNCYYLENDGEAILVDAGISAKQIVNRMANLGLSMSRVKGLFISHEHTDHIRGVDVLSRRFSVPVFLTRKTYASYGREISASLLNYFSPGEQVEIGGMRVSSFLKNHDAAEPCSFLVSSAGRNVAVMTDIGLQCPNVVAHLRDADAIFLETNYDDDMLKHGPYPSYLKARIASDVGHLSNAQAAMIALQHASPRLQHIVLSHISENNNTPELAFRTFDQVMKQRRDLNPELSIASRYRESGLVSLK